MAVATVGVGLFGAVSRRQWNNVDVDIVRRIQLYIETRSIEARTSNEWQHLLS